MRALKQKICDCDRSDFVQGCIDSAPVCIAFVFMFFSIGVLLASAGFSFFESVMMTVLVHAAPLQVFIGQSGGSAGLWALVAITLLVNFRFMIMSSVLCEQFKSVSLLKMILSVQLLSVSTFTLASARKDKALDSYRYYLGCGISSLSVAVIFTGVGCVMRTDLNPMIMSVIGMILPIHFTALAAMSWPKWRPVLATIAGFIATPLAGAGLGAYQVFVVPLLLGALFLVVDKLKSNRP